MEKDEKFKQRQHKMHSKKNLLEHIIKQTLTLHRTTTSNTFRRCPRGTIVKAMDCGIVVREFVLQSGYYVHFRANTLGKSMNPLIFPAMG